MMIFALVATVLVLLLHAWLGLRLSAPFEGLPARLIQLGCAASAVAIPMSMVLSRTGRSEGLSLLAAQAGFVLMGLWSVLVGAMLVWELLRLTLWLWDLASGALGLPLESARWLLSGPEARGAAARLAVVALLGLTALVGFLGLLGKRAAPVVERVAVPLPELPAALEGLRIAQISDVHIGPTVRVDTVRAMVEQVNALEPDLVVLTGDLADGSVGELAPHAAPLADLRAPLGRFFVTGNHEYYSGVFAWLAETERLGFTNLVNEHRVLERGGARLVVAGVTDERARSIVPEHRTDAAAALAGAPAGAPRILLAHQPRSAPAAAAAGADLILSGHTHGGQYVPWTWAIHLVEPYITGLYRVGEAQLWVNRGTGTWGPPLRLGSRQEITLLELTRGS